MFEKWLVNPEFQTQGPILFLVGVGLNILSNGEAIPGSDRDRAETLNLKQKQLKIYKL